MKQTRIIKNPRKVHHCYACSGEITGEHIYSVSVIDGDFYYGRFHFKCDARIDKMCGECIYKSDCQSDLKDCFYEKYVRKESK